MISVAIADPSGVAHARREASAAARKAGFNAEDEGRVALVATELGTNVCKHGRGGELVMGPFEDATGNGVELVALDKGPGIASVSDSLRDGFSTAGSAGTGMGAVLRQAHAFDIFSRPGQGTAVLARLRAGRPAPDAVQTAAPPPWGVVCLPLAGEEVCGDSWCAAAHEGERTLLVVDGLGHGPQAALAAAEATRVFGRHRGASPSEILKAVHAALKATRGAAVSVVRIEAARRVVVFAGIGNVAGTLISSGEARRMVSHNGTAGQNARRIQEFEYPFEGEPMIVLASDGLGTSWSLDAYPGLQLAHPTLIAAVLYRDFTRGRDDVTVLVARGAA